MLRVVMNKLFCTLLLTPLAFSSLLLRPAQAQTGDRSLGTLYDDLQTAVCLNNWDEALSVLSPMIGSSEITATYRDELIQFRQQVQTWRARQAVFSDQPNCDSVIAQADAEAAGQASAQEAALQAAAAARQTAATTQPEVRNNTRSTMSQCVDLANVMNWAGSQAESMLGQANFNDLNSLVSMLGGLATVSEQAATGLQGIQLTNRQLQTYQQSFTSLYQRFHQVTDAFVSSANAGSFNAMEQQNDQLQNLAEQEFSLINQVNSYCGSEVITVR
ncbi:MAG: hypothetical protein AAGA75_08600 [Cyanobacteria bacterium P01_E01_bin.6]